MQLISDKTHVLLTTTRGGKTETVLYDTDAVFEKYGVSPKADLINMRLESAKRLLLYTTLSVDEIALQCGFGSIYHFSKIFKSIIGVSPSIYRHNAN